MVKWIFRIQPLPNSVSIARTVQASIACNQPIGAPVPFNVPAETSFLDDTQAKPGTLYGYSVCANWDSGSVCAPNRCQGLPAAPPPPSVPTYPRNLSIAEKLAWVTPTLAERRWIWGWTAGNGRDYGFVSRQEKNDAGWDATGSNLKKDEARFEDVVGIRDSVLRTFRVCGANFHPGGGPFDLINCSNIVQVRPGPVPLPKAPVSAGATATSRTQIDVNFAPGDENVTAWFDVERLNGPGNQWFTVASRVRRESPGHVVDNGRNPQPGFDNPFTYRVCASNGTDTGRTCTASFKATVGSVEVFQPYNIVGLSGKCLDAAGGGTANGTPIILFDCHAGANQTWVLPRDGSHSIGLLGGKCLDVTGANPTSGTRVELWDCNKGANQSWLFNRDGSVKGLAGKCLDVAQGNPANGTPIILWDCHGTANQKWSLKEVPR